MKNYLPIFALLLLFNTTVNGQEKKIKLDESKIIGSSSKSEVFTTNCTGLVNNPSTDLKWRPILSKKKCIGFGPIVPNADLIKKIKAEKNKVYTNPSENASEKSALSVTPVVGTNYLGNVNNGYSPLDNSMAISNGGWIVSVANTTIEYDDINGNTQYYNDIVSFINDPIINNVCDPVVIYDPQADRFIFFAQECAGNSSNSYLLIFFSKTNNPMDGWWYYKITGNPLNDNSWFDYPKLAVSTNELYISGNLFDNTPSFNQSILYQINKNNGYSGGSINWSYWYNISGSPFTLLPVSYGHGSSYGPGCYLVATDNAGSSNIKLYDLTDDLTGSPALNLYNVSTTAYSPTGYNADQLGTTCQLKFFDCRALSGFYLNGIIHFVFHSDIGSAWWGINYNRLTVSSLTNHSSTFGLSGSFDYGYPSVVSYATSTTDKSVMINFGRAGSSIYPEIRVVNCDNSMSWSSSTLVKNSSSYVTYSSTTEERWGDYTGASRKHNSSSPSVWINGSFGNSSHKWDAWVAEIHGTTVGISEINEGNKLNVYPNPVIETFNIEFSLQENIQLNISILDIPGKIVKNLYDGKALQGDNFFTFNKANLSEGTYFLVIKNNNNIIKNEKIIIAD